MPVSNGDAVAEQVADLADDLDDGIDDGTNEGMGDVAQDMRLLIENNDSVASGRLVGNARPEPLARPSAAGTARISFPAVYWYVEMGTGAAGASDTLPDSRSFPAPSHSSIEMLDNLQSWIDDKGIVGTDYDEQASAGNGAWSPLAVAIAEAIVDFGTEPHPFVRPVWYSNRGKVHVRSEVARRINRAIRRS